MEQVQILVESGLYRLHQDMLKIDYSDTLREIGVWARTLEPLDYIKRLWEGFDEGSEEVYQRVAEVIEKSGIGVVNKGGEKNAYWLGYLLALKSV